MSSTFVSIVIPCRNERNYIGACLESIAAQSHPSELLETLVVDGNSDDGTRELLSDLVAKMQGVRLIDNPAQITPVAMNLGIDEAKGSIVIIFGAHAKMDPDYVARCVALLEQKPEVACVGGQIINVHENHTAEVVSRAMRSPFGVGNARFRTGGQAGYVDTVAFGAYRTQVLKAMGGFDAELARNQDDDLNYRLVAGGHKIYFDPAIRSAYYVRGDFGKLYRQYYQYGYWKVYVNKKHQTVTSVRQLVPFFFVVWLIVASSVSLIIRELSPLLTLPMLLYFIAAIGAALAVKTPSRDIGGVVRTFATLHFAYGWGYARGLIDFILRGKKPGSSDFHLSR